MYLYTVSAVGDANLFSARRLCTARRLLSCSLQAPAALPRTQRQWRSLRCDTGWTSCARTSQSTTRPSLHLRGAERTYQTSKPTNKSEQRITRTEQPNKQRGPTVREGMRERTRHPGGWGPCLRHQAGDRADLVRTQNCTRNMRTQPAGAARPALSSRRALADMHQHL